jgi:hypothetical protein
VAAKLARRRILERTLRGLADAKATASTSAASQSSPPHPQQEARKRLAEAEMQRSVCRSHKLVGA